MYCDDELNQVWLQAEFLAVVNEVKPEVCGDLYATAFGLYKQMVWPPEVWELMPYRINEPQVKALSDALDTWATKSNLTAEWCKAAAYFTLQAWIHSSKPGEFFWHPPLTRIQLRYPPPDGLPEYKPEFGRELYLKEVEKTVREAIVNHPLLKLAQVQHRIRFIEAVRDNAAVKKYCESVEKASKPFTPKKRRELTKHLTWAARIHVRGDKQIDIVNEVYDAGGEISPAAISSAIKPYLRALKLRY